jgi:putative membrane protein
MTTRRLFVALWSFPPGVLLACAALVAVYLLAFRVRPPRRSSCFFAGVLLLLFALTSPLAALGHGYLFSAHMIQHLLLVLAIPPLWLLGLPPQVFAATAERSFARALGHPLLTWTCGGAAMWLWHWPPLHDAALHSHALHVAEHVSLLVLGTAFWWPVISPPEHSHLQPLLAVLYLFTGCLGCTVLGIVLTFAPAGLYPAYLAPPDPLGILPRLRDGWGLSDALDQQIGGLLMWIPACLIYLSGVIGVLARWYRSPESESVPPFSLPEGSIEECEDTLRRAQWERR